MSSLNKNVLSELFNYLTQPEQEQLNSLLSTLPPSLATWLSEAAPAYQWDWAHLVAVRDHLEAVTRGDTKRLMLFMPPRHGKSTLATVHYPAARLEANPRLRVVVACYNSDLAATFSRQVRGIVRERGHVPLDDDRQAANDWRTRFGGGLRAIGVGSGITGHGADLLIIDDPIKSREEADLLSYRDRVWRWYSNDLYTRLEPDAAIILIVTRWHMDDLAGRLLESERAADWMVLRLPALAEANDPLGRAEGAALCPQRYDVAALDDFRAVLGPRSFDALYQQRPRPSEGALFRREWFDIVGAAPATAEQVRYWDTAGADEGRGDYTVGVLMARDEQGMYYVEDVTRGQWTAHPRNTMIRQTAGLHPSVPIYVEQPPGLAKESTEAIVRALAGFVVHADPVRGDKISRAEPFAAQCEAGNVKLVRGAWNRAYLDELCDFPYAAHDDQVDASSGAFKYLIEEVPATGFSLPYDERTRPRSRNPYAW
jgi:predicted phage terminase large subunit-like protein